MLQLRAICDDIRNGRDNHNADYGDVSHIDDKRSVTIIMSILAHQYNILAQQYTKTQQQIKNIKAITL